MQSMTDRRLLVVGCARSGTRATTRLLKLAGVDVGHERINPNGSVNSFLTVDDYYYPAARMPSVRLGSLEFHETWHQIRHPLRVIESIESVMSLNWWHWQEKHTGISLDDRPIERSARYWLTWNYLAEENHTIALRFRIEDIEDHWNEMLERLNVPRIPFPDLPTNLGHLRDRDRRSFDWSDLGIYEEPVRLKAKEYGYDV